MPGAGAGIRFGQYVLLRRIARGGMAEVFLAQQRGLEGFDRRVAVKRILPHLADAPDFIKMFLGEAKLAAQLTHPNIVHIYDFGKVDADYFIAMEYIEGVHAGDLFRRVADGDRLSAAMVARIGADAAAALHYAHEVRANGKRAGLVHRDVSPATVMVSFDGVVKLCDFGIAKAAALSDQLTNPGTVKGKYAYMSPEQTTGSPLDGRSDVFALSIILWELLAGTTIVPRGDAVEAMRMIRDGKLMPIERAAPHTPTALASAITWGLQTKREHRPAAMELAHELESFLKSSPELATAMQLGTWLRARFPREPSGDDDGDGPGTEAAPETHAGRPTSLTAGAHAVPIFASDTTGETVALPAPHRPGHGGHDLSGVHGEQRHGPPHGEPSYPSGEPPYGASPRASQVPPFAEVPRAQISRFGETVRGTSQPRNDHTSQPPPFGAHPNGAEGPTIMPFGAHPNGAEGPTIIAPLPSVHPPAMIAGPASALAGPGAQVLASPHANAPTMIATPGGPAGQLVPHGQPSPHANAATVIALANATGARGRPPSIAGPPGVASTLYVDPATMAARARAGVAAASGVPGRGTLWMQPRPARVMLAIGALLALALVSFLIALAARGKRATAPADAGLAAVVASDAAAAPAATAAPVDAAASDARTPTIPTDAATTTGNLEIRTRPDGATLKIAGQAQGAAPTELALTPGRYFIDAELEGWMPERRAVEIVQGERVVQEIVFGMQLTHSRTQTGRLIVRTTPPSEVFLGTRRLADAPFDIAFDPGTYTLQLKHPRHATVVRRVTIAAGKTTKLIMTLP